MPCTYRSIGLVILSLTLAVFLAACGDERESAGTSVGEMADTPSTSTVESLSADGKRCIELVKAKRYGEAIDPCSRALEKAASVEVENAYAEAKAAMEKEAKAAAMRAAQESAAGGDPEAAARAAAGDALRNPAGE